MADLAQRTAPVRLRSKKEAGVIIAAWFVIGFFVWWIWEGYYRLFRGPMETAEDEKAEVLIENAAFCFGLVVLGVLIAVYATVAWLALGGAAGALVFFWLYARTTHEYYWLRD